jgi:guanyl-specific ribonuclease Sa
MGWFDWLLGKEKKPPEPLVLGAKLRCPYGSHDSYLYVDSQNIKINNLPKACVEDCKALLNIQPFGDCYAGGACETLMKLNSKWENPVPQGEKINGKEIITTKSLLACKVVGAEFKIISSGQDGIFAKQILLMQEMDQKYPGLREILDNPYGSLYLNKGMYKKAIQFIEDQTKKNGGDIDSFTLFDEKNIEGKYLKSAFGHLMPYCDTSTMEGFVNGMQTAGVRQNMSGTAGWDELKINKKTIEFLKKDCKETANRIETKPFYRWQEENKVFSSAVAEGVTALAYGAVMYAGIKNANSNQNKYSKPAAQEVKSVGGGAKDGRYSIPDKAKNIADQVKAKNGAAPKGFKGGKLYQNMPKEGAQKLPEGINYKEYDVNPYVKGQNRGTERIIVGDDGSVWYTNNHYDTFIKIE